MTSTPRPETTTSVVVFLHDYPPPLDNKIVDVQEPHGPFASIHLTATAQVFAWDPDNLRDLARDLTDLADELEETIARAPYAGDEDVDPARDLL